MINENPINVHYVFSLLSSFVARCHYIHFLAFIWVPFPLQNLNGFLYDITSVGPNIDLPVADFYKTAVKRKTEVLFVELKNSKASNLNEIITAMVKNHYKVTTDTSCLVPVKEFINKKQFNVSSFS